MAAIVLSDLGKAFGGAPLYDGFDLEIAAGEVVALMGPSGVGKSTLLRIVAGIDKRFTGRVAIDGVSAAEAPAPGFMFQDARLLPWLTIAQNLRLARRGLPEAELAAGLHEVGLGETAGLYPRQLSGGMQRRVALARAVLANPRLLLLDEPFTSLDATLRDDMLALIGRTLAETGATALIATHRPDEAARLAHRVVILTGRPVGIAADMRLAGDPAARSQADVEALLTSLTPDRLARKSAVGPPPPPAGLRAGSVAIGRASGATKGDEGGAERRVGDSAQGAPLTRPLGTLSRKRERGPD